MFLYHVSSLKRILNCCNYCFSIFSLMCGLVILHYPTFSKIVFIVLACLVFQIVCILWWIDILKTLSVWGETVPPKTSTGYIFHMDQLIPNPHHPTTFLSSSQIPSQYCPCPKLSQAQVPANGDHPSRPKPSRIIQSSQS